MNQHNETKAERKKRLRAERKAAEKAAAAHRHAPQQKQAHVHSPAKAKPTLDEKLAAAFVDHPPYKRKFPTDQGKLDYLAGF